MVKKKGKKGKKGFGLECEKKLKVILPNKRCIIVELL